MEGVAASSVRLLVVDRQPTLGKALASLLHITQGFEVVGILSPEEAIQQAATLRANVGLLDVVKPYATSERVYQALCALSPCPFVIALTTFADPDEEQAPRRGGGLFSQGGPFGKTHPCPLT